jgi:putative flippase GtrA
MTLLRQGGSYLVIGLLQLLLDGAVFIAVTALGMPVLPGNLVGRACGMLLGFWLNGRYTFASGGTQRLGWARFSRFIVLWAVLTALSTALVVAADHALGRVDALAGLPLTPGPASASPTAW